MSKDKVNTNENKGLLWNVLLESGKFTNIPNTNVGDVRNAFENKIHEVLRKSNQSDTLVILNKRILEEITIELERYKTQVITHAEISDEKQKKFNKNLETKQKEFKEFINNEKPDEISFSEEKDTPIGSEMDMLMASAMKRREEQLNVVLQHQNTNKAEEWINNDNNKNINIKIGDRTDLTEQSIEKVEKHVSFQEETNDFLSQLKVNSLPSEHHSERTFATQEDVQRLEKKIDELFHNLETRIVNLLNRKNIYEDSNDFI